MEQRSSLTGSPMGSRRRISRAWCTAIFSLVLMALIAVPTPASAQLNKTMHTDGWILAAAHAPGFEGSIWRTDLWVRLRGSGGSVTLTFCKSGLDNTDAESFEVEIEHTNLYIEDVVDRYLGVGGGSWVGAIHYETSGDAQVYARVYSISPDGSQSYGQLIEGIPTGDMTLPIGDPGRTGTREDQWMFAAKHTSDGRFRVNVGAVNPTGVESGFYIQIFDETGNSPSGEDSYHITIPPFSMIQLSDPFADVNGGDWSEYTMRVEADTVGSGAFGYVSVVDNATNDAFFVRGVKLFDVND